MTRFQEVDQAIASLPAEFNLRAFPGVRLSVNTAASYHDGESVQIVLQRRSTEEERRRYGLTGKFVDFGRDSIDVVRREIVLLSDTSDFPSAYRPHLTTTEAEDITLGEGQHEPGFARFMAVRRGPHDIFTFDSAEERRCFIMGLCWQDMTHWLEYGSTIQQSPSGKIAGARPYQYLLAVGHAPKTPDGR